MEIEVQNVDTDDISHIATRHDCQVCFMYALFRHKQIHVSRPHMGDMASEKCINSKA